MSFLKKMQISIESFSELEIEEIRKNFNELEKSLNFKKPRNDINIVHYEDLDKDEDPDKDQDAVDDKHRKIGSVKRLFKEFSNSLKFN